MGYGVMLRQFIEIENLGECRCVTEAGQDTALEVMPLNISSYSQAGHRQRKEEDDVYMSKDNE